MRKTSVRWRRAALAGTLAATLAAPVARAQQGEQLKSAPAQDQQAQPAAQDQQAQPAAQDTQPQQAPPPAKNETAPVVTEQSPRPPPDTNIQPVPGTPEEYVIQKGDTLWDLSQKFLNNPWYCPNTSTNNPSIQTPPSLYPAKTP